MSKRRPGAVGFLRQVQGNLYVGAEDWSDPKNPYHGPTAEIWIENSTWLKIVADRYDNHLILNVETIPFLIKALKRLEREVKRMEVHG